MCGTVVSASASECPGCGEQFSPVEDDMQEPIAEPEYAGNAVAEVPGEMPEYAEETAADEPTDLFVPDDTAEEMPEPGICEACDTPLNEIGKCPACQPPETAAKPSDGCPLCSSKNYSKESGDLVSCSDCGNVYVMKDFEPAGQNWKWKFWVGLVFIMVGNVGVALGSYIHNVLQWPAGAYFGYGRIDRMVGVVGIVLFILGLMLFAWSFKREREIECPSCKVVIRESQFEIFEAKEGEEDVPKEDAVKSALDEIGEMMECPSCGAGVSIFDTSCGNCGAAFETQIEFEEPEPLPGEPEQDASEPAAPDRYLTASEINEEELVMESLELENPEQEFNGNGITALDELESAFNISMEEGATCPTCGARVGKGLDTCPGCGEKLNGGE